MSDAPLSAVVPRCLLGHATHPDPRLGLALAAAQIEAQRHSLADAGEPWQPTLCIVYLTEACAPQAEALLDELRARWPGTDWVGCAAWGVAATGVEYLEEPALVLLMTDLPRALYALFHGRAPLEPGRWHSALVHAAPGTPDLDELIQELAERTRGNYLFGGLSSARNRALHIADGVHEGGLSGVAFDAAVGLLSRVTQGCQPIGRARTITRCQDNLVQELDGAPALPQLLAELGVDLDAAPERALQALRHTLAGLTRADGRALDHPGQFGPDTEVRHLVGVEPTHGGVALAEVVEPGTQLTFCRRDRSAAQRDLVRVATELREALEPADLPEPTATTAADPGGPAGGLPGQLPGAIFISCSGRGGPHFGGPSAELLTVQRALGELPLAGFFAAGEIAFHHLYGYTGVLSVFHPGLDDDDDASAGAAG
ncbi:FIST signal transduction protein [Pseudaquabacterium rugosum]|uniref:FIST N-terminal domain-containing protein n=1 Tax=Pseudaquabacterium rugosum TaxID=2984194 RepID=A0ABU9BBC0_9BURK